ncbi:hypothetical protein ACHAPU_006792 [Fusarium lateritium]
MSEDSIVPGRAELEGSPAPVPSSSSVGDESSDTQQVCVKSSMLNKQANKSKSRHVKIVTSSDVESSEIPETTESASGDTAEGSVKPSSKANKKKAKAKAVSSTDNESSEQTGEISTDADNSAKSSKISDKDPNWSISEDCRLRSMKEASETWNFIATSLRKTRTEVKKRWKVLQNQMIASEQTTEAETDNAATEAETSDAVTGAEPEKDEANEDEESEEDDSNQDGEDDDDEVDDDDESEEKTSSEVKSKGSTNSNVMGNTSVNHNKWHKGPRNTKVAIENKWAKARAKAKDSGKSDSIASGQEASGETSGSSSRLGYGDPEKQKQMKYLQDHIYKEMYPPEIHPKPDAYLGKRDCDLLATIDSKYKKSRWLEMQVNFYNVTGRMVPLEAIRNRCERAETEKEERAEARKLERRLGRVEDWIADQACENSQD